MNSFRLVMREEERDLCCVVPLFKAHELITDGSSDAKDFVIWLSFWVISFHGSHFWSECC